MLRGKRARQPSLGGRGRLPFGEGEMSAKPTERYGPVGHEVVDEGNLYNKSKRDKVQALRIMKSCLRHDEIIKLTFYNEIFRFAEFVLCADEIPPAAPFGFDRLRMTRRVTASFSSGGAEVSAVASVGASASQRCPPDTRTPPLQG